MEDDSITYAVGDKDYKAEASSAVKPYVAAKLVDLGKISWDTLVDDSPAEIENITIRCWIYPKNHGEETFKQSIIQSCRPPIARAAVGLTNEEVKRIFEPLAIEVSDQLEPEEIAKMAVGSNIELPVEQLAKAYGGFAQESEMVCSIMSEIAERKIEGIDHSLGMAKGRGESSSKIDGGQADTIVLLWPIDSPKLCCVMQYPMEKEIYKWIEALKL